MARMRSLKPEFWADEELACQLTRDERMLYIGLWNLADEHARLRGDPRYIKGQLFPYDDDITPDGIEKMLVNLAALGKVQAYRVGVGRYLFLPNLKKHQRLDADKVPSRLPDPDESEPDPYSSGSDPNESAPGANMSGRDPDSSGSGADKSALMHVAGGMEHVAGGMEAREHARPPKSLLANSLLEEHTRQITPRPPRDVTRRTGEQIDKLLDDPEIKPGEIAEALALLRAKPNAGPGLLPDLVHEVRQRNANGNRASPPRNRSGHRPYQNPTDNSVYKESI